MLKQIRCPQRFAEATAEIHSRQKLRKAYVDQAISILIRAELRQAGKNLLHVCMRTGNNMNRNYLSES